MTDLSKTFVPHPGDVARNNEQELRATIDALMARMEKDLLAELAKGLSDLHARLGSQFSPGLQVAEDLVAKMSAARS